MTAERTLNDHMATDAEIDHALAYPFDVPAASYLFHGGRCLPMRRFDPADIAASLVEENGQPAAIGDLPANDVPRAILRERFVPVIAAGSNAAPDHLARKFAAIGGKTIIPTVSGIMTDGCTVYSAHISRYGSVPATLVPQRGARTRLFCTFVPERHLEILHKSESLGLNYGFFKLEGAHFEHEAGRHTDEIFAYLSLWGALQVDGRMIRLPQFDTQGSDLPQMGQAEIQAVVARLLGESGESGASGDLRAFIASNIDSEETRLGRVRLLSKLAGWQSFREQYQRIA